MVRILGCLVLINHSSLQAPEAGAGEVSWKAQEKLEVVSR